MLERVVGAGAARGAARLAAQGAGAGSGVKQLREVDSIGRKCCAFEEDFSIL